MTSDQWQAHVTREAAKAIGQWLEGRGRLHQPIAALTMAELEAMAANAISPSWWWARSGSGITRRTART
jgi:hypothetical protein